MVFLTTSQYIRLEGGPEEGKTYLYAECDDGDDWKLTNICLDDWLGISEDYKGFDTTKTKTASNQDKLLSSYFVPGSLTIKNGSVLYGKVREEYGGWDTSIYLDLLFDNKAGSLVVSNWTNSLVVSAGLLGSSTDRKSLTGLLIAPNAKLAASELLLSGKCSYFDVMSKQGLRPSSDGNVEIVYPFYSEGEVMLGCRLFEKDSYGFGSSSKSVLLREYLSSDHGKLSMDTPDPVSDDDLPAAVNKNLQKQLPDVAFNLADEDSILNVTTRATALCVYTAVMTCGAVMGSILCGRAGAAYTPALAFMAGSTVKSATGSFVQNPKMSDEVAAVAIYRVMKKELPTITGLTVKEVLGMADDLRSGDYKDEKYLIPYKDSTREGMDCRDIDNTVFGGALNGWGQIITSVRKALAQDMSEDELKHMFNDKTHDGLDILNPPPTSEHEGDYLSDWVQTIQEIQAELYLLAPDVGGAVEESTKKALEAISNGLDGLNKLLEFWPDYKGDDETNETRKSIIESAGELISNGIQEVKDIDQDSSVLDKVLALEEKLTGLKSKFQEETAAEKAELEKIKPELQTAVDKMFADLKLYQSAQNRLSVKIKVVGNSDLKHESDGSIAAGVAWYKDLLRRRTSALEETQSAADAAATAYLKSEEIVVNLQANQAKLNNISKRRFAVDREITKAEIIIADLKLMINGARQQEDRILSIVDLLKSTFDELMHVGEPPYHRQNRKIEDQLCTAVLKAHRESLIDTSFADSTRNAVTEIQSWFDDDMPNSVQEEIDAITKNPLYPSSTIDEESAPLVGGG